MVFVITAWTEADGELNVRISRNSGKGFERDTIWASSPEEVANVVSGALRSLT